ncbi:Cell division protein FtsH, partial [hydrothermal vent metagenome]
EKYWTAYHEAGHAVIAYLLHPTNDVIKATIIPRRGALGFISQRPVEELHSSDKDQLMANIKVSIAAYVAEKMKFGMTSSGVGGGPGSDFDTAIKYARYMVWSLGMGESGLVGDFTALPESHISESTREKLDADIQKILLSCIKEVEETLKEHNEVFEKFAQELLKKEDLEYDEIISIFDNFGIKSGRFLSSQNDS